MLKKKKEEEEEDLEFALLDRRVATVKNKNISYYTPFF